MAAKGNAFALLEGDDDGESLLAFLSAAAAVKPELPPSAVDIRSTDKTKKPRASSLSSFQSSSALQRSSDHEKGREKWHGSERNNNRNGVERQNINSLKGFNREGVERQNRYGFEPNSGQENGSRQNNRGGRFIRDGVERQNRNGFEPTNGQENGSRQNNHGGIAVKRNNGYRHEERPAADGLKQREGNSNGYQKKEKVTNGHQMKEEPPADEGWQVVVRSNGHKKSNANAREGSGNGRERNYGRRREFNNDNGSEGKQHLEESGENGVSNGSVEILIDNSGKDEKEYRNRNGGFGGNGRANGYGRGEGSFNGERGGNSATYQQRNFENAAEGEENGKSSESTELCHGKEVQKDGGELNAGDETALIDSESSKVKHDKVVSKEESETMAERELEAKQMTLKQYEKQLEEKRKGLESLKAEERRVALDKEFESMQMIEKKNEETNFVKLNHPTTDKPKKKVANNKDDNKVKYIIAPPRRPRTNNLGGRGGGGLYDSRNAAPSYCRQVGGNALMSVKLSFKDAEQFPALALDGSTKPK